MSSNNITSFERTTNPGTTASIAHAAAAASSAGVSNVTQLRPRSAQATSYGEAVKTSNRHETSVKAVAAKYERFEDALLPMVLASGVTGEAAIKVAESIMASDPLRNQAETAHRLAREESSRRANISLA